MINDAKRMKILRLKLTLIISYRSNVVENQIDCLDFNFTRTLIRHFTILKSDLSKLLLLPLRLQWKN